MSEFSGNLSEDQRAVLDRNTLTSAMSGLAIRYHRALSEEAARLKRLSSISNDPAASFLKTIAEERRRLVGGETPIAFSISPSNMAVNLDALMVDAHTGEEIPSSKVQVGLVGGLAGDGHPVDGFTPEDLTFAVEQLKAQKQVGLVYGIPDSSGFISNY